MDALDEPIDDANIRQSLEKNLAAILCRQNLDSQREIIQATAARLNIDLLDCAAALLYLSQPQTQFQTPPKPLEPPRKETTKPNTYRFVRYRLDVGSQHNVAKEQIQAVLIDESGVDRKRIGRIDIRHNYTLVELPDGMPADIFQLLSEATIGERKLAIKRVKPNRRGVKGS